MHGGANECNISHINHIAGGPTTFLCLPCMCIFGSNFPDRLHGILCFEKNITLAILLLFGRKFSKKIVWPD